MKGALIVRRLPVMTFARVESQHDRRTQGVDEDRSPCVEQAGSAATLSLALEALDKGLFELLAMTLPFGGR